MLKSIIIKVIAKNQCEKHKKSSLDLVKINAYTKFGQIVPIFGDDTAVLKFNNRDFESHEK